MDTMNTLQNIFRDVFGDPDLIINETMTPNDIEGWDSLAHVNLIVSCEAGFKMRFPLDKLVKIRTVKDLATAIDEHKDATNG